MATSEQANSKKTSKSMVSPTQDPQGVNPMDLETRVQAIEKQLAYLLSGNPKFLTLDDLIGKLSGSTNEVKKVRKVREYTDDERKAIRERLEAGKLAKLKGKQHQNTKPIVLEFKEPHEESNDTHEAK